MREYELIAVFNLSYAEAEGQDAAPKYLENVLTNHGGNILKIDHWGRRRLAYPIDAMLDADYVLTRVELDPEQVREIEATFRINERILRFMTVRADELPVPPPPREEEPAPAAVAPEAGASATAEAPAADAAPAPETEAPVADPPVAEAPAAEAPAAEAPAEAPDVDPAAVEAAVDEPGIEAAPEGNEATQEALTDALGVEDVPVEPEADTADAEQEGDEEPKAE